MAELFHWFGNDLQVSPSGDLATVEGTVKGQQLVVKRLLTKVQGYIFELPYGAGLAAYIGTATAPQTIEAIVRAQLLIETSVAKTPVPTVTVTPISNGLNIIIQYVDAQTGAPAMLNFNVND